MEDGDRWVFEKDGSWWFYDKDFNPVGPYISEDRARAKLDEYYLYYNAGSCWRCR
jgi:hypothetical protein